MPRMRITDIPASELLEKLRATERANQPDQYAVDCLRREVERRLALDNAKRPAGGGGK